MDLLQTAAYFDTQLFDAWNFSAQDWDLEVFSGQLKRADTFVSIWNRPTRKRMLYTAPDQRPTSSVIRVPGSGEVLMVGNSQDDEEGNTNYRSVFGLHKIAGTVVVHRLVQPAIDQAASNTTVITTFGDFELRSVDERIETKLEHYGDYFAFMPSDTPLQRDDTIVFGSQTFLVLETYKDSGLITARVASYPDDRVDFSFRSMTTGSSTYDVDTQTNTPADSLNCTLTGRIQFIRRSDSVNTEVQTDIIKISVRADWLSVSPKVGDEITYINDIYKVFNVTRNSARNEWYMDAKISGQNL